LFRCLSAYLENLCDYLYDDLRPRILHEQRLTALCEVCTVLQALMVLDAREPNSGSPSSGFESDDTDRVDPTGPRLHGLGQLHTSALLQMVLQDAQTRLFFKAQAVVQAEIRHFVPTAADLAYPEKLIGA
jgi:conserved oligomeric Golgi complex subunit 3